MPRLVAVLLGSLNARLRRSNTRLRTERDRAQAAVEARDDLMVAVSHELRTPLTAITTSVYSLRHDAARRGQAQHDDEAVLSVGGITLDQIARRVIVDGQQVHLTPTQYELLRVFISNPDRVLTQRTLLVLTFGPAYEDAIDNLRTFITQLRRKVERDPSRPQRIVTEPGLGYRFRSEFA